MLALLQQLAGLGAQDANVSIVSHTEITAFFASVTQGSTATDIAPQQALASPADLLKTLQALLDKLEMLSPDNADADVPADIRALFAAFKQDTANLMQSLSSTQAQDTTTTRDIVALAKDMLSRLAEKATDFAVRQADAQATMTQSDNDALFAALRQAMPVEADAVAEPKSLSGSTNFSQSITSATAAVTGVAQDSDAGTQTGSGNRDGGQSMPQNVQAVRSAGAQQTEQTNSAAFSRLLTPAGARPVAEQVVFHVKTAIADGSSRIRIQLDPEELGKLDIRIHVGADGRTGVTITADNRGTLDMLQRDSRGLEQALADAGLKADSGSLSFNLRGGQQEQNAQNNALANNYMKQQPEEEELAPELSISRSYVIDMAEGLDIRI